MTPTTLTENLKPICALLHAHTRHDFSLYKTSTMTRRVEQRMTLHHITDAEQYLRYLQHTPAERDALFHGLLIGVTQFFRDPEVFSTLEALAVPRLFANKPPGAALRVWVPGCSTGEEAYSLTMLLQEHAAAHKHTLQLQVFATDIDPDAIAIGRRGRYPATIAAHLTPARLARFFTSSPDHDGYQIHKGIRERVIFAEHNINRDPPFSKVDLISCRNLLIYMGGELQRRILPLFHFALNPNGLLLLGTAESAGELDHLFTPLSHAAKLYQRHDATPTERTRLIRALTTMHLSALAARPPAEAPTPAQRRPPLEAMRSLNEDLQAANEELEASKEELRATNEELTTTNAALEAKVAELSRAHNDIKNLLDSTGLGVIFVDTHRRIQRFTPPVTQVFNLIPSDVGRPLDHIAPKLPGYTRLTEDVQAVLDTLAPCERQIRARSGAGYLLHIRPYRTLDNAIDGAVLTFMQVTTMPPHTESP